MTKEQFEGYVDQINTASGDRPPKVICAGCGQPISEAPDTVVAIHTSHVPPKWYHLECDPHAQADLIN